VQGGQSTPLRLIVTDNHIALVVRGDVLPADMRQRLDAEYRYRQPLRPREVTTLITLITEKILEPFPSYFNSLELLRESEAEELLAQGLPVSTAAGPIQSSQIEPHPDIMFAPAVGTPAPKCALTTMTTDSLATG
jgi:hypothetical protein